MPFAAVAARKEAMTFDGRETSPLRRLRAALPSEHGFWVMLAGAVASALFRAGMSPVSVLVAAVTAMLVIAGASAFHRRIRRSGLAQLAATLLLSLAALPIELAGGVPMSDAASATIARAIVFVTSALVVRAAFARASRHGGHRTWGLHLLSVAIASSGAIAFYAASRNRESIACAMAAGVCAVFAYHRPTVKELKLLGLTLSGLVLASATALAL